MIITRTPYRISFFGGGTDYPAWYREHGGSVLSTSINKYCYINVRYYPPFFDHKYLIRYSKRETPNRLEEIEHPSVRACLEHMNVSHGVEIVHSGDIPAMSGVGSSSAFTVGLLHALHALQGKVAAKRNLAGSAVHVEQNMLKENVGTQDQVAVAFGGLNRIDFGGAKDFSVQPMTVGEAKLEYLQEHCMLFFTGFARYATEVAASQLKEMPKKHLELHEMKAMVDAAADILQGETTQYDDFGKLLDEGWRLKRSLSSKISNDAIDDMYATAKKAGALGGKLCGAGGGGFLLLYVPQEKQNEVKAALKNLLHVPFAFDGLGSQLIMYAPQDVY
jgi:D-glycero-alpha-D-manno-heptose-7-phosphate kinase